MSTRVNIEVNNKTNYTLTQQAGMLWGGPYGVAPPQTIGPNQSRVAFSLNDNDRAGVVYLATDSNGNEMGYVTMSYTCPELSDNSAEGSSDMAGFFISAGLQVYSQSGTPANFIYNVGEPNKACWSSGSSDNGEKSCDQTTLETWARVIVGVQNPTAGDLNYKSTWQSGLWVKQPESVPSGGTRISLLNDNDRAGIYYSLGKNIPIHLSFTCPKLSGNSAEGSPLAGLQHYPEHGTPALFTYIIGEVNSACWSSGSSNDEAIECDQTNIGGMSSWMKDSISVIGSKTLAEISIPGSHDSGMSVSNDGTVGAFACNTQTQTQSIGGQLNFGTRYFDIRPIIGGGQYYTGHYGTTVAPLGMQGARGQSIANIITEINAFTASNSELVILNLSHDFDTDSRQGGNYLPFTAAQWTALFEQLIGINDLYLHTSDDLTSICLNDMIGTKSCVLVIVEPSTTAIDPYLGKGFFKGASFIHYNSYSNTNGFGGMSADQILKMKTEKAAGKYFLLSWTLTQDNTQAATCELGTASSILDLAETANWQLSKTLMPNVTPDVFPNIIYIDDFCTGNSTVVSTYLNQYLLTETVKQRDLGFIKTSDTGTGTVEVHVASHASGYQTIIEQTGSAFALETDGNWMLVDFEGTGEQRDLAFIKTSNTDTGTVEVHVASHASGYQTMIIQTGSAFALGTNGNWMLVDFDGTGKQRDLAFIETSSTGTGTVEVHVASYSSGYQTMIIQTGSAFAPESNGAWMLVDFEGTGEQRDLAFIKTSSTGTGTVEVHVASYASNYQSWIIQTGSIFGLETNGNWMLVDF
tara:strand:+ start:1409 stop:3829 length:2421 start_codon:yes stop_codon:yes gene_type:complete